jgi:hypothetical protein
MGTSTSSNRTADGAQTDIADNPPGPVSVGCAGVRECTLSVEHDSPMTQLSGKVEEVLREANALAEARGHSTLGTDHVLLAMTKQSKESLGCRVLDGVGASECSG